MTAARLIRGFVAGFLAVLVCHQAALLGLHRAGIAPAPWNLAPVPPFGVPAVVSAAFWGGLWGSVFVLLAPPASGGVRATGSRASCSGPSPSRWSPGSSSCRSRGSPRAAASPGPA